MDDAKSYGLVNLRTECARLQKENADLRANLNAQHSMLQKSRNFMLLRRLTLVAQAAEIFIKAYENKASSTQDLRDAFFDLKSRLTSGG